MNQTIKESNLIKAHKLAGKIGSAKNKSKAVHKWAEAMKAFIKRGVE